jgi:hypothetical protein
MVRHARFAFNDSRQRWPEDPDRFDDRDDRLLDDWPPAARSRTDRSRKSGRHLAGGDWTEREVPCPPRDRPRKRRRST